MNFEIVVPHTTRERITGWSLGPEFELRLFEHLRETLEGVPYPSEPDVIAPVRFCRLRFQLESPTGTTHAFFFAYNDWEIPGKRVVNYARCLV